MWERNFNNIYINTTTHMKNQIRIKCVFLKTTITTTTENKNCPNTLNIDIQIKYVISCDKYLI